MPDLSKAFADSQADIERYQAAQISHYLSSSTSGYAHSEDLLDAYRQVHGTESYAAHILIKARETIIAHEKTGKCDANILMLINFEERENPALNRDLKFERLSLLMLDPKTQGKAIKQAAELYKLYDDADLKSLFQDMTVKLGSAAVARKSAVIGDYTPSQP